MKLTHKNFLYTGIVAITLTVFVIGYFAFMLPSLYVAYMSNENYNAIVAQHRGYLKYGSYENVSVKNLSCMTIDIPLSEDSFTITGTTFQTKVLPSTDGMRKLVLDIKAYTKEKINLFKESNLQVSQAVLEEEIKQKVLQWKEEFLKQADFLTNIPLTLKTNLNTDYFEQFGEGETKVKYLSSDTVIIEVGAKDGENQYVNYIGFTFNNDHVVVSYLPAMTPQMNQIIPIVMGSLPMLIAVIILFALVVSHLYSKGIVEPIIELVRHTEAVKQSGEFTNKSLKTKGNDEIAVLVETLNGLYEEIEDNNMALENKNIELREKNRRQEFFLRASSHQLKTPVSAALLLIESMINKIGKYQNTEQYLPEVKKQLLLMRKIIEDVLHLSNSGESIFLEQVDLNMLVETQLSHYHISLGEGNYELVKELTDKSFAVTDAGTALKVLDNLISNAVIHSKNGSTITITTKPNQIEIHNTGAHIEEDLIPNIFEPFVSGSKKGHGLGLYIVAYYANILRARVEICNTEDGVLSRLIFEQDKEVNRDEG